MTLRDILTHIPVRSISHQGFFSFCADIFVGVVGVRTLPKIQDVVA